MLTQLLDTAETIGELCIDEWRRSGGLLTTKWIVSGCVGLALLCTQGDPKIVLLVFGALVNALLGKKLKRWLSQPRPGGAPLPDPGMPSSHALSLFFLATFAATDCLQGVWQSPSPAPATVEAAASTLVWPSTIVAPSLLLGAALLSYLRVRNGLHTAAQVAVGAALGLVNGAAWSAAVDRKLAVAMEAALQPWGGRLGYSGAALLCIVGCVMLSLRDPAHTWEALLSPRDRRQQQPKAKD